MKKTNSVSTVAFVAFVATIFIVTLFHPLSTSAGSDGYWMTQWVGQDRGERIGSKRSNIVIAQAEKEPSSDTNREGAPQQEEEDITKKDETGTDPRGFGAKFMPYYRFSELENGLEVYEFHVFGVFPLSERVGMTYDLPVAKKIDYSDVPQFKALQSLPPSQSAEIGAGGIPFDDLDPDGDVTGMGDLNLRLLWMPKALDSKFTQPFGPNKGKAGSMNHIFGVELWLPTANEDVLGNDAMIVSPMYAFVVDTPLFGFFAAMNFWQFDAFKEHERPDTNKYAGRWFLMQPLTKPGPWYGGIYLMPEFQPIYDFENDDFSLWIGPEVGKMLAPGKIIYAKPGWGIDREGADRKLTFEAGFRWFF